MALRALLELCGGERGVLNGQRPGAAQSHSKLLAFWSTLPGILTGLAALITAMVGLVAFLTADHRADDEQRGQGASPDGGASDSVTMSSGDYADLEQSRVGSGFTGSDLRFECAAGNCYLRVIGGGGITLVGGPVDRSGCVSALKARQERLLTSIEEDLTPGNRFCVQTNIAGIALAEIIAAPDVGTTDLILDYTLMG
jgi:hypothetical protein